MKTETNKQKMASEINVNEVRSSAFQSLLPVSECAHLARCGDGASAQTSLKPAQVSPRASASSNNSAMFTNNSSNSNGNSPKMGSRRIFTPQFKLQVLESYRSDSDCKGNQRATARKYNIHRRQIQKWLQCESNLRSSVANINQNSVKHQFHNISHHQQQAPQPSRMQLPHSTSSASLNGTANGYSHHHPHHHSQALALNSLNVPSMPPRLEPTGSTSAQGVLAAANLAAAVAVAIASTSSPSTSTTAVSPLRPTAINGTNGGVNSGVSKLSPSLLHSHHHHHHHHFPMSPYTHSPVAGPVPVTVPMLPHHLGAPPPQPHALHQHYPYHNLPPHTHSHSLRLSHQPSAFLPTACLPVNVLSAVAAASTADVPEKKAEENHTDANVKGEFEAAPSSATTTAASATAVQATIAAPANAVLTGSVHGYIHDTNDYECMYRKTTCIDSETLREAKCKNYLQHPAYQFAEQDCLGASMTAPMDLSLGRKRRDSAAAEENTDTIKCHLRESSTSSTQIVDLTFRKRKVITASALSVDNEHPQKLAKRLEEANSNNNSIEFSNGDETAHNRSANDDEDEEVEIEVDVEAKQTSSKPVKLFKPYLLDNNNDCDQSSTDNQKASNSELGIGEQRDPIIWINHPAYDSSRASSIYSPSAEKHTFHGGSPYFPASKPSSPQNVLSPVSAASFSPTNFLRCPKGSPVSGYESSSSICSERDETCSLNECRSYSLDIQMQATPDNKLTSQPLQIRQWLDQDTNAETNTPPLARASIALYA